VEAGWKQVEEGKVSDFDPAAIKRRGREKLARFAERQAVNRVEFTGPALTRMRLPMPTG